MPAARSSTWAGQIPRLAHGDERRGAQVRLLELLAERRVVARAVGRARLDDDDRGAARDALLGRELRELFRLVVVADEAVLRIASEGLVDDPAAGVAEDVDGREVDDPGHARRDRGIEDALGGPTLASNIAGRSETGIPTRYEPAAWMSASAPRTIWVRAAASDEVACDQLDGWTGRRPACAGSRTSATTWSPRAPAGARATADEPGCAGDRRRARVSRPACRVRWLRARS